MPTGSNGKYHPWYWHFPLTLLLAVVTQSAARRCGSVAYGLTCPQSGVLLPRRKARAFIVETVSLFLDLRGGSTDIDGEYDDVSLRDSGETASTVYFSGSASSKDSHDNHYTPF